MLSVSVGAILAFIGILVLLYAFDYVKKSKKNTVFLIGLGILLIGLGMALGITISLTYNPSLITSIIVIVIGALLLGYGFYEK